MAYKRKLLGRRVDKTGRSKGEGQYTVLSYAMLTSAAWRSLSGAASRVFLELRTRFHGANNGKMHMSLEETCRLLHLGKGTVLRALDELEDKGFVVCIKRGIWYGHLASEWAITDKGIEGAPATNAWKHWQPDAPRPSTMRPRGRSFRRTRPTPKHILGSKTDPSVISMGPYQNRTAIDGSKLEPVEAIGSRIIGSRMDR